MSTIIKHYNQNLSARLAPFTYQAQAYNAIKDLDYAAIFHEQGLGKTKIAIDLLLYWLNSKGIDTVLIITKKQLIQNWLNEFSVHTYIKPKVLSSNLKENFYVLNSPARVIITNYETISTDKERLLLFLKSREVAAILDESAKIKNPNAKLSKDLFDISPFLKMRVIMTGTPVANRPYDIWSQVYFLDRGKSLGERFSEFKSSADLSSDLKNDNSARDRFEAFVSQIFPRISAFSIRETKSTCGIILPKKSYQTLYADFESRQKLLYTKVITELRVEIQRNGKTIIDDESEVLKRLLRLVQISSNPRLLDDGYCNASGKENQLDALLLKIMSKGEKCIVWSSFVGNIDYFAEKYSRWSPKKIHGKMSIAERNKSISVFLNDNDCKVLFATPQAAKEGLTLTVANHVIFYDRGFNLDDYLQAQDRIHRISQKKHCYIYNIVMRDSVDIWINDLLEAKLYAALLAQGDMLLSDYKARAAYTYSEILAQILSPNYYEN